MRILILAAIVAVAASKSTLNLVASHGDLFTNLTLNTGNPDHKIVFHYSIGDTFRGYSAIMGERLLNQVRAMSEVKYVERDQIVRASEIPCQVQTGATWGLVRTTLRDWNTNPNNPLNQYEHKSADGKGVEVYIIDTGIDVTHPLFQGRANRGADFVDNPPPSNGDPNGHGTHVAGTVMSDKYGLARSATAISVRVLNDNGSGDMVGIIAGIHYVAQQKQRRPSARIVATLSIQGGLTQAVNDASDACVRAGVHVVVSAGNSNKDACRVSPASAPLVVTVAASDTTDSKAYFSNYGTCVDIIAPGVGIISTSPGGGVSSKSGTSMAAPHVAGVIAKILSATDEYDEPQAMKTYIKSCATKGKITGFPSKLPTDNDLIFYDCK